MKSTGFTLIELLAVIVILAIIALIATPIILGIIKDSEKKSKEISIKNYASAIEQAIVRRNMKEEFKPSKCEITDRKVFCDDSEIPLEVQVDGETPKEGTIMIENGTVVKVVEKAENKYVIYENGEILHNGEITEPVSFKEDSWETISLNVKVGNIGVYETNLKENTNNKKEIDLTNYTNQEENSNGLYTVRIANTSTPEECATEDFSQTACGFVIEFEDIITEYEMNPDLSSVGGYPSSSMYTFINNKIYNSLPTDLKSNIKETIVVSSHGSEDKENFRTMDKLYLLSTKEVYGKEGTANTINDDTSDNQTRQLDYYGERGVTITDYAEAIKKYNDNSSWWWLRSANSKNDGSFYFVKKYGDYTINTPYADIGVAPAFRIG